MANCGKPVAKRSQIPCQPRDEQRLLISGQGQSAPQSILREQDPTMDLCIFDPAPYFPERIISENTQLTSACFVDGIRENVWPCQALRQRDDIVDKLGNRSTAI